MISNTFLIRLWLIAALLYGGADSFGWVRTQKYAVDKHQKDEQITTNDGQVKNVMEEPEAPYSCPLMKSQKQHRVGSSRPARVLPTHSGKPSRSLDQCNNHYTNNALNYIHLTLSELKTHSVEGVASLRLYYVIALRRILC